MRLIVKQKIFAGDKGYIKLFNLSMVRLHLTNVLYGAKRSHHWCLPSVPYVLGTRIIIEKGVIIKKMPL